MQMGISEDGTSIIVRIIAVLAILILAYAINLICRKAIIPAIRKVTSKTESKWDDHLLGDDVVKNA